MCNILEKTLWENTFMIYIYLVNMLAFTLKNYLIHSNLSFMEFTNSNENLLFLAPFRLTIETPTSCRRKLNKY